MSTVTAYVMDPALDTVLFGDEITEGMWVLPEDELARKRHPDPAEDTALRQQRFRRITRLRVQPPCGLLPAQTVFIGEWIDGYQEMHSFAVTHGWIVRKAA
jgi:hypothetical protein